MAAPGLIVGRRGRQSPPPLPSTVVLDDRTLTEPADIAEHYARQWEALWARDAQRIKQMHDELKRIRSRASILQGYALPKITAQMVRAAIKKLRNRTALGIDLCEPEYLKELDDEALELWAELFNDIERAGVWPSHIMVNLIILMGKPTGGTRPIALMPMLYRIWT